jgi:hypothetical protein
VPLWAQRVQTGVIVHENTSREDTTTLFSSKAGGHESRFASLSAGLNTIGRFQGLTDTLYMASSNRISFVLSDGAVTVYFFVLSTDRILKVSCDLRPVGGEK